MELADLSLDQRIDAALAALELFPNLTAEQRQELVAAAVWPNAGVMLPSEEPAPAVPMPHTTPQERQAAVELISNGVSTFEIAARCGVSERSVRRWIGDS